MADQAGEAPEEIVTDNLCVRFYRRDPDRVVVVFASAGSRRENGFSEEFAGSLRDTGVSTVFVTDRHIRWYNYPDTAAVLGQVAQLVAPYRHVGVLGESLGASGALLFTKFACNISRVLAFAPQYSVAPPFVKFDGRYNYIGEKIARFFFGTFAEGVAAPNTLILYGNTSWRDYVHASMFSAAGFTLGFVDGAPHEISRFLNQSLDGDQLRPFLQRFCDFEQDFDRGSIYRIAGIPWTDCPLREGAQFSDVIAREIEFADTVRDHVPLPLARYTLVSQGKRATQSSISKHSIGKTPEEDASGALNGKISGLYQFHTASQNQPWWRVDLETMHTIREIRIFNRINNLYIAERAYRFMILASANGSDWDCVHIKDDMAYFGGADGRPYIFIPEPPLSARFIKIQLLTANSLHLDQVQIFGEDTPLEFTSAPQSAGSPAIGLPS